MVLCLGLRLVGTDVREDKKTQDATITTRFRGIVTREELAKFSGAMAKTVFDDRVWGSSLSTGAQPGLWAMHLFLRDVSKNGLPETDEAVHVGPSGSVRLASIAHCRLKDLRFASKTIKEGKKFKTVMFVTVVVEHENGPGQKALVCAVPSNVSARFETEVEEPKREAVGGEDANA
jgi:hypothetical protein